MNIYRKCLTLGASRGPSGYNRISKLNHATLRLVNYAASAQKKQLWGFLQTGTLRDSGMLRVHVPILGVPLKDHTNILFEKLPKRLTAANAPHVPKPIPGPQK